MNNEEILKLANKAGFCAGEVGKSILVYDITGRLQFKGDLAKFAALVQAAAAEECAKVCESQIQRLSLQLHHHAVVGAEECASTIRRHSRTTYLSREQKA